MATRRIYQWARARPDKTALICSDAALDYAAFARAIDATCRFLAPHAAPAGRLAMVLAGDLRDAWFIVLALQSLGLDTIAVRSLDQAAALALKDVACVVVSSADQRAHRLGHYAWPGAGITVVPPTLYDGIHTGDLPTADVMDQPPGGHILLSSGTTGSYKKILRDGATADKVSDKLARVRSFHADMVYYASSFGLWTATGYAQPRATWHAGGCVIFDQGPDYLANLFRCGPTHTTLLPPEIKEILAARGASEPRLDGLTIHCGGGFLPLASAEAAIARIAGKLLVVYGATECILLLEQSFTTRDDLFWLTPTDGRVAQIVDDAGRELPAGSQGVLRFRLMDTDSRSYIDNDEASARAFRDGYFYPGDLAVRRADGRIRVVGRAADVVNLHGQKVATAPIELSIQQRLGVDEVCLFTTLSDAGKEELLIALQSSRPVPQAALDALGGEFASFDTVRFAVLEAFPRTTAGLKKVDRIALRQRLLGQGA